jgi:hypothetical protein
MNRRAVEEVIFDELEQRRLDLQHRLDSQKKQTERNQLGQFSTPTILATDILEYAKSQLRGQSGLRFLDPAFGSGSFYSALLRTFSASQIAWAKGFEVDPHYGREALEFWRDWPLILTIADFTQLTPPATEEDRANLLICNPPYVRHHHLAVTEKQRLSLRVKQMAGLKLNGLAGLYCYFLMLAHDWLASGGLAGWLIPSEFMDVNYGQQVKRYLLDKVTLLHLHRFNPDDVQFDDALVSSVVVWFRKEKPPKNHKVRFSYGGSLIKPQIDQEILAGSLSPIAKWTTLPAVLNGSRQTFHNDRTGSGLKLGDLFQIKRGLVTGANKFFILTPSQAQSLQLPPEFLQPILPSPRYLDADEIFKNGDGNPVLAQQLFLLNCNLPENDVKSRYPNLWGYLQTGVDQKIHQRYLCRHRSPWYSQEVRPAAPLVCPYMGRISGQQRPFRFILNHSQATAPNVYLMLYPKPRLQQLFLDSPDMRRLIWRALNRIPMETLIGEGRLYGGGLHKIEPNELGNAPADVIAEDVPQLAHKSVRQLALFD